MKSSPSFFQDYSPPPPVLELEIINQTSIIKLKGPQPESHFHNDVIFIISQVPKYGTLYQVSQKKDSSIPISANDTVTNTYGNVVLEASTQHESDKFSYTTIVGITSTTTTVYLDLKAIYSPPPLSENSGQPDKKIKIVAIVVPIILILIFIVIIIIIAVIVKRKLDVRRFFPFEAEEDPLGESEYNQEMQEKGPQENPSNTYESLPNSNFDTSNDFMLPPPSVRLTDSSEINYDELEISTPIAKGWQGEVFRGKWRSETVNCAIKILFSQKISSQDLEEIYQEASIHKGIRPHSNVVSFFGICIHNGNCMIVTEYLAGGSLEDLLKSNTAIPFSQQLGFLQNISAGMLHLALENVIHRDLAARNCFLNQSGEVKVGDFGLSKFVHNHSANTIMTVGPLKW